MLTRTSIIGFIFLTLVTFALLSYALAAMAFNDTQQSYLTGDKTQVTASR